MPLECPALGKKIAGLALIAAVAVGCSSTPEREPVAQPTPEPTATTEEVAVVEQPPTVVPTAIPTLDDDLPGSVTNSAAGTRIEDVAGNLVAIHGLQRRPEGLEDLEMGDLFGRTETVLSEVPIGLLDISWCSPGEFAGGEQVLAIAVAVEPSIDVPIGTSSARSFDHALVDPQFEVPMPGTCSRGWLPVSLDRSGEAPIARYVLEATGEDGPVKHVYQWRLTGPAPLQVGGPPESDFGPGQVVSFSEGPLADTTVTYRGWAEVVGAESPLPETRVVGVLVEVCPATEDWPEIGLGIEGWNLLGPIDPADRLGADPLAPLSGSCFEDWAEFAVPFGLRPSAFFVSDGIDPVDGFASWPLDGTAIAPPS